MQDFIKALVDLLSKLGPYVSVPLLLAYGGILFIVIKVIGTLKDERIAAAKELVEAKNQRIAQMERENEALRQREVDPNKLLAEVNLIRMSTEEKVEAAKRRLNEALEKLQARESEVAEVRSAHNALLAELNRARERAEALTSELHSSRLNSERGELLRIQEAIMHEILSPVHAIVGHAELLLRHNDQLSPEKRENKLREIISEGLLLSQVSTSWRFRSRQDISLSPVRARIHHDILIPAADMLRIRANQQEIRLIVEDSRDLPYAQLDVDAFRQALLNVLDNAIKYSFRGRDVHIAANATSEGVAIDIQNWGLSISADSTERIFEVGFRGQDGTRHYPEGVGLGLYVAKKLLNAQGCDLVLAQREPSVVFRISIPKRLLVL